MHERLTRSSKNTPSDVGTSENGALSEMKLEKKNKEAVVLRTKRKRRRIDSDSENDDKEDEITEAKKTRAVVGQSKSKKQAPSKERKLRVVLKKIVYTEKTAKDSSDEDESSSEKESGMASSYISSSSSSSDRDSDSPVPTSEMSDSSFDSYSSYESSGNEDISWRIRKSPRKKAQADSRKKIAELRAQNSDSEDSTTSESESYHSDD